MSDTAAQMAVMQAHLEGRRVERQPVRCEETDVWVNVPAGSHDWNFEVCRYRVAEERGPREWEALEAENAALRAIFPKILDALGNGAFCTGNNSLEFLESIPDEVKMHVAILNRKALRGGEGRL
jgi:hypothetical protein